MTQPVRLQLSRREGFNLQDVSRAANGLDAVVVARPGKWGNPFTPDWFKFVQSKGFRRNEDQNTQLVKWFDAWLGGELDAFGDPPSISEIQTHLRGKNLACWCKPGDPCHADVLLELANQPENTGDAKPEVGR